MLGRKYFYQNNIFFSFTDIIKYFDVFYYPRLTHVIYHIIPVSFQDDSAKYNSISAK
jgi:hypothetical protein